MLAESCRCREVSVVGRERLQGVVRCREMSVVGR